MPKDQPKKSKLRAGQTHISLQLSEFLLARVDAEAAQEKRPRSAMLRILLEEALDERDSHST